MSMISIIESGRTRIAASVISQLIVSIITTIPSSNATDETICDKLWLSVLLTVSTSFVTRDKTSPCVVRSKYFSGNRSIFAAIRSRRL